MFQNYMQLKRNINFKQKMNSKFFFNIFGLVLMLTCINCTIILTPPVKPNAIFNASYIFIQGANIPAVNYKLFALQMQQRFRYGSDPANLWVALTEFPGNLPEPLLIDGIIKDALKDLQNAGFTVNLNSKVFFAGHSLGGAVLQEYLLKNNQFNKLPVPVSGIILEGSFVSRNNREIVSNTQVPPILTLGAELDGLCRITRIAESFYFNLNTTSRNIITIAVWAMNHYQFAGDGNPPEFVAKNDIQPEISAPEARAQLTNITNAFMQFVFNKTTDEDNERITGYITDTGILVNPIIQAFELEGFYHFNPPCYNKPQENCVYGSKYTEFYSQKILGGVNFTLDVTDQFWIVYDIPEHLPVLHNNCTSLPSCVLNITTVSQAIYSIDDALDNGFEPVAADEIRTKLVSRQAILYGGTGKKYDFNQTDGDSLCGLINKQSIEWALQTAPFFTVDRYQSEGVKIQIGSDIGPLNAGPLWIWTPLSYERKSGPTTNTSYVEVRSPTMKFPLDYTIKSVSGIHYCKVLSPARAIEWLYVDSLKPQPKTRV